LLLYAAGHCTALLSGNRPVNRHAEDGAIMRRLCKPLCAFWICALFFVFSAVVQAETLRGQSLLRMLTGESDSGLRANLDRARAMGYLQGMQESYLVTSRRSAGGKFYCLPDRGISSARLRNLVVRWLQNHPKRLEEPAILLIFHALADEFPCR